MSEDKSYLSLALKELAAAGVRHPEVARGSKHLQLRWFTPRGERRVITIPGTPSDWRSPQNTVRDLRRILREDGMLEETGTPRTPPPRQPSRLELLERRVAEVERRLASAGIGATK
jgi:hypothetical protein